MWRLVSHWFVSRPPPMLGRWCHRSSPAYPLCDPGVKNHLANVDNGLHRMRPATPREVRERDPVTVFLYSYGI